MELSNSLKELFIQGVLPSLQVSLVTANPPSLTDAITIAQQLEALHASSSSGLASSGLEGSRFPIASAPAPSAPLQSPQMEVLSQCLQLVKDLASKTTTQSAMAAPVQQSAC